MGDRRTATFFCISDTDSTYNFLVALAFSQMFNLLCERADNVHGGRLPHHVRVLWDEAANTGQVPGLEKLVAVIRSREISLCLLYQQLAQCKAIYDKNAETILGNMDIRELDRLQSVDIGAVDPAMLPDAGSVALNAALPQRDRVSCLVQAGINPYCFCVGGVGVKIEFSEDGPSLQDTLAAFLLRIKSGR